MFKLYIGNDTYISLSHAKELVNQLRKETNSEYILIDGDKTDSSKISDILTSSSLFNSSRLIFLKRIYRNKDKEQLIPFLLEYLERNSTDNIIIWEDQKVSAVTKYVKYFKTKNLLEEYDKLNKRTFITWAKEIVKKNNIQLETDAINLLIQYSNFDTERFENNLRKLKLLGKELITSEDVREIAPDTLEEDIWKLLDEMNIQNGKPLKVLEKILNQKVDPNFIFSMIARNMKLITMTKHLTDKHTSFQQIASILKVPPFTVKPLLDASEKYSWEKIVNKYHKLCNLDYEIKTGRIEPKLGLTLFCTTT
ncbi:MAG: polymerase III subunit delta, DNA polymerase III subunit delta protein [candidate division WS6 bacterium GW2011_GWC1_33_20]|uniref:DNA polymerase III subunit delta n=2 Tax=Candidatus Dojkabacteria TaxID=74243 RepID=A0A0G0DIH8_9BACT|nr:MAG: polymerase III subunit delta, DNA polymerase III subunit delta protein [candidate division WS6 bacterium GW2011_GWE2_33_157]KKP43659.1 MAG: polymerase III subunit delta, DNA polymerase III subunit delta protein [candidate division WS6 bacterium GW2011_GWC1_33_20]KKP45380.1 MAG: polymerase III subunit delta, DNA polymerase III subunit delta protein [candidate division WS6 bacterium GW2011_GWF1_33_233]KKP54692.1 MAG: polymerase III subunit delta, DNA polymerase III subunit delta protein [c